MTLNLTSTLKSLVFTVLFVSLSQQVKGQASTTVHSSNGYDVHVTLGTTAVIAPSSCPWGYNYNVRINYNISFSGSNIPANLYTLQANLACGSQNNFTQLPLSGGSGTRVTSSNPWRSSTDCGTITASKLNCNTFNLVINGPGIPNQTIAMSNIVTLPVQLVSFDANAEANKVLLNWKTSSELNNNYFVVERSNDGNNWETVKRVESAKNSNSLIEYTATDDKPMTGMAFYRLKQVDVDGAVTIFNAMQAIDFTPAITVSVYPNPAANEFSIEGNKISEATVSITDCMGKSVSLVSESIGDKMVFNTSELANGIYFINVELNGNVDQQKLTVRH
jgi:hypothetical protein